MVQPKKQESLTDFIKREAESRRKNNPIIKTRWYVVEITPPQRIWVGDGHGGSDLDWTDRKTVIVSPYFELESDAQRWLDDHLPDKGNTLEIRNENLRRFTEERWVHW